MGDWVYDTPRWVTDDDLIREKFPTVHIDNWEDMFLFDVENFDSTKAVFDWSNEGWEKWTGWTELLFKEGQRVQFVEGSEFDYAEGEMQVIRMWENLDQVLEGVITKIYAGYDTIQVVHDNGFYYLQCYIYAKRNTEPDYSNYPMSQAKGPMTYICGVTALGPTDQDKLPPQVNFDLRHTKYLLLGLQHGLTKIGVAEPIVNMLAAPVYLSMTVARNPWYFAIGFGVLIFIWFR